MISYNAKVALNIHRVNKDVDGYLPIMDNHKDAYSIGPRLFEAVACGSALLTDFRQEAVDIFGDSISYFKTPEELGNTTRFLLENPEIRMNMVDESMRRIKDCTFTDRLDKILLPVFINVKETYMQMKE